MKNKKIIIYLILSFVLLIFLNLFLTQIYKKHIYETYSRITTSLANKYPEDEALIVNIIINGKNSNILEKYGVKKDDLQNVANVQKLETSIFIITCSIYLLLLLLIFFIYRLYQNKVKREVKQINSYLNEILNGTYELNIADYNEDEFSILKNDIYKVTMKLKEYSEYEKKEKKYLKNTLEDISHQLKTPLTALTLTNDILLDNDLSQDEQKEFLKKQTKELEKMEWLITTLLKVSKLNSGEVKLKKEKVLANTLIEESLEPLLIPLELKNASVVKDNLNFEIICDKNWTVEALTNILKNACEHIKENGCIKITGLDTPLYLSISIKDNGEGISKKEIKKIFKRFYSTTSNNNFGIGLHMAKVIMENQNGKIEIESVEGKYTTFKMMFFKQNN